MRRQIILNNMAQGASKMNRDKLRKYADRIEALPDKAGNNQRVFNMRSYYSKRRFDPNTFTIAESCNSPSCMAGWVCYWEGIFRYDAAAIHHGARMALGLSYNEAVALFTPSCLIYNKIPSKAQAVAAMRRLADEEQPPVNISELEKFIWQGMLSR